MALLAPSIVEAILDGTAPDTLTFGVLARSVPTDWQLQTLL